MHKFSLRDWKDGMRAVLLATIMAASITSAARALVVTYAQRSVSYVSPGNTSSDNVTSTSLGDFSAGVTTPFYFETQANQTSFIGASSSQILVGHSSNDPFALATTDARAQDLFAGSTFAYSLLRLRFTADNLDAVVNATFDARRTYAQFGAPFAAFGFSLYDITLNQYVFAGGNNLIVTPWTWSGTLAAGHQFEFLTELYALAESEYAEGVGFIPGWQDSYVAFGANITETPNPELPAPASLLLLLLGLGLIPIYRKASIWP